MLDEKYLLIDEEPIEEKQDISSLQQSTPKCSHLKLLKMEIGSNTQMAGIKSIKIVPYATSFQPEVMRKTQIDACFFIHIDVQTHAQPSG